MTYSILDVCCGSKSFWFDKDNPSVIFSDIRKNNSIQADKRKGRKPISIEPNVVSDFRNLPFPNNSFSLVVFDPPHADFGKGSYMRAYYGNLEGDWKEMLQLGFSECFRVLRENGFLVFKWNDTKYSVKEILNLTSHIPLFGNKSGKQNKTHWIIFVK